MRASVIPSGNPLNGWFTKRYWKATLNNLRLLIQPFVASALLWLWLLVFPIPDLAHDLYRFVACINGFP